MWNVLCSNGSFTIDLAAYGTYKYICLYNPKSSSHKNHSVSDVHAGNIVYSQLAMRSRIRIRLGQEAIDLTPNRVSSVTIVNTFPALESSLTGGNIDVINEDAEGGEDSNEVVAVAVAVADTVADTDTEE